MKQEIKRKEGRAQGNRVQKEMEIEGEEKRNTEGRQEEDGKSWKVKEVIWEKDGRKMGSYTRK